MDSSKEFYMRAAMTQAKLAARRGEVPVGAVIVRDGVILARAYNTRESGKDALCHAEIKVIHKACKKLGGWRLPGCELYVTLEPCPMCAGAIINARIPTVYFGASDPKAGAFGSLFDMNRFALNHHPVVYGGLLKNECADLMSDFFGELRRVRSAQRSSNPKES